MQQLRTLPHPKPRKLDPDSIVDAFAHRLLYSLARDEFTMQDQDAFQALAFSVRDRLIERWFVTQDAYYRADAKRVYYLSLEFLLGRLLVSNILNLGPRTPYTDAMARIGTTLETLAEKESDAGLGNGGLGRLAACFLDSAATLGIPFYGYGIRYEYGIFRQWIVGGEQTEAPDNWLRYGTPWEIPRPDVLFPVQFYGRTEYYKDAEGRQRVKWADAQETYAMAYDFAVPGFRNSTVNSLRLWAAKSSREFDLAKFNAGAYVAAVEDKNSSENISKVLYPPDDQHAGKELRLKQQHFFTSATVQDVIRRFKKYHSGWEDFPDHVAIQLNDTHPAIAIAEMMHILVDHEALEWEYAWRLCQRIFAYTNHTVLPEALEVWPLDLMRALLPRHAEIIIEIDRRSRAAVLDATDGDNDMASRMAIIDGSNGVRMAHLAIIGSHSVNGVAALHTSILKSRLFADFHRFYPRKFNNKTNGITPRRWLLQANPELSALITETIGDGWASDLDRLKELEQYADHTGFRLKWRAAKNARKHRLARWIAHHEHSDIDPHSLYDVQIKRIHEYKRQLLNVLHVIGLYHRITDGEDVVPRTVIFGGKSAPGYRMAKLIIKLIHDVASLVRSNPRVSEKLSVLFVPNYDVSSAEMLFPATELSEQISTAGTEASGTGCMKAVLNGGVIIGTLDGANIEIRDEVGVDNMFVFGKTAEEIEGLRAGGYDPQRVIESDEALREIIKTISRRGGYDDIVNGLLHGDRYFLCADFASYVDAQNRAAKAWLDHDAWTRMSILNSARSGRFSADRTVADYAREIWGVEPVPVNSEE